MNGGVVHQAAAEIEQQHPHRRHSASHGLHVRMVPLVRLELFQAYIDEPEQLNGEHHVIDEDAGNLPLVGGGRVFGERHNVQNDPALVNWLDHVQQRLLDLVVDTRNAHCHLFVCLGRLRVSNVGQDCRPAHLVAVFLREWQHECGVHLQSQKTNPDTPTSPPTW